VNDVNDPGTNNSEKPWFLVLSEDGGWKWMELTGELP
jgi:hypothetical protein